MTVTPVGWVIGSAIVAGAAGYGLARMVRSGATQDVKRKGWIAKLQARIPTGSSAQPTMDQVELEVESAVRDGLVPEPTARRLLALVSNGALSREIAVDRISKIREAAIA